MSEEPLDIEKALNAVGEILESQREEVGIVVLGGTALNLLGIVHRTTKDVDILAIGSQPVTEPKVTLRPPNPLPESLTQAIKRVARDFGLPEDWMNAVAGSQWRSGLPPSLEDRLEWRRYRGLHVGIVSRYDLIFFKLYAAVDSAPTEIHYQDLRALHPSQQEVEDAARWVRSQDMSEGFGQILDQVLDRLRQDLDRSHTNVD